MDKSDFQLISQRIIRTDFTLNKGFTIPLNLHVELDGKTEIKDLSENSATVVFSLSIYNNKSLDKVPFQMEVVSEGKFSWNSPIEKKQLNNYLNFNAPSILLSYIRSVVSMITSYAGLSNFMIPLINFYKSSIPKKDNESQSTLSDE